jgi:hypothetical protein
MPRLRSRHLDVLTHACGDLARPEQHDEDVGDGEGEQQA